MITELLLRRCLKENIIKLEPSNFGRFHKGLICEIKDILFYFENNTNKTDEEYINIIKTKIVIDKIYQRFEQLKIEDEDKYSDCEFYLIDKLLQSGM